MNFVHDLILTNDVLERAYGELKNYLTACFPDTLKESVPHMGGAGDSAAAAQNQSTATITVTSNGDGAAPESPQKAENQQPPLDNQGWFCNIL